MSRSARRALALAAVLVAAGLLLVVVSSGARWLTAAPANPELPGAERISLRGSSLVAAAVPLALLAVAALAAAASVGRAAHGTLRLLAALVILLAGLGSTALIIRVVADPDRATTHTEAARQSGAARATDRSAIQAVALVGGLLQAAAGAVALGFCSRWPGLEGRYERDARGGASRPAADRPELSTWDALERGDDPTATPNGTADETADETAHEATGEAAGESAPHPPPHFEKNQPPIG